MTDYIRLGFHICFKEPGKAVVYTRENGSYTFMEAYIDWTSSDLMPKVIEFVLSQKFVEANYYAVGNKYKKFTESQEIIDYIRKKEEHYLSFKTNQKDELSALRISLNETSCDISISIRSLEDKEKVTIKALQDYIWEIIDEFREIAVFGLYANAGVSGYYDFPRIRPLRQYGFLGEDTVINVFNHTFFNLVPDHSLLTKDTVDRLSDALSATHEFPIQKKDDLLMVTWTDSLEEEALLKAFSKREDFIYRNANLPVDDFFNELGDKKVFTLNQLIRINGEDPFWSYYYEKHKFAFKLIVLDENKLIDAETIETIKKYAANPKLENGDEITKLLLILPDRKYLGLIDKQAKAIGIYKLFYFDDKLNIWDVNPIGNWKN